MPSAFASLLNTLQIKADYSIKPAGLKWRSNTLFIVSTVAVGLFSDLFLYGLIVPVLPFVLQDRVGVPKDQIQSHVSGLLAAYAAASELKPFSIYVVSPADDSRCRLQPICWHYRRQSEHETSSFPIWLGEFAGGYGAIVPGRDCAIACSREDTPRYQCWLCVDYWSCIMFGDSWA